MVDWASQDRLYPSGYRAVDIRYRSCRIDSSLPYSVSYTKRHNCRSQSKQYSHENRLNETFHYGLNEAIDFHRTMSKNSNKKKSEKLIAKYLSNINWPRSVCCLAEDDGSLIVCEQDRCRLLLFSSHLMLRSTYGGKRGNNLDQFDSPWSVATLTENSISYVLVADTNNQRIQFFNIQYNGQFVHRYTLMTKGKPYFLGTSQMHFAVSGEKGLISTYLIKGKVPIVNIDLNEIVPKQKLIQTAFCLCMDPESSYLFVSNPLALSTMIYQLTVTGGYLRSITLAHQPFLQISSMTFDSRNGQLVIADSLNSIIYSVEHDLDEDNVEILFQRSDNLNSPQGLCIGKEGHLIVVECSVLTQHALKIFRHHSCVCHSRLITSSIKTSETTSVRSVLSQFEFLF